MNLCSLRGKNRAKVSWGVWDGHVHIAIFKMNNQKGPSVPLMKLCSLLCGSLDGRGACGRMDPWICAAESLHCSPGTITKLIVG